MWSEASVTRVFRANNHPAGNGSILEGNYPISRCHDGYFIALCCFEVTTGFNYVMKGAGETTSVVNSVAALAHGKHDFIRVRVCMTVCVIRWSLSCADRQPINRHPIITSFMTRLVGIMKIITCFL